MEEKVSLKRHLKILSKQYTNIEQVAEEIINLQAILNLPKGTELFLSDIHGEYGSFSHILNNGSGIIRNKIEDINLLPRRKISFNKKRGRRYKRVVQHKSI